MNAYSDIANQHLELVNRMKKDAASVNADEVLGFISSACRAGSDIGNVEDRAAVLSYLRFWAGEVHRLGGLYPNFSLLPYIHRPWDDALWRFMLVLTIATAWGSGFLAGLVVYWIYNTR